MVLITRLPDLIDLLDPIILANPVSSRITPQRKPVAPPRRERPESGS